MAPISPLTTPTFFPSSRELYVVIIPTHDKRMRYVNFVSHDTNILNSWKEKMGQIAEGCQHVWTLTNNEVTSPVFLTSVVTFRRVQPRRLLGGSSFFFFFVSGTSQPALAC
jgi:hypothetical protein